MLKVLSIDGGGIRGIIPATVLMQLEQLTGRPTHQLFDLLVGTSTGGILTLALTCPQSGGVAKSAAEARSLYLERGGDIFPLGGVPLMGPPTGGLRQRLLGVRRPVAPDAAPSARLKQFLGWENMARIGAPFGGQGEQGNARYPAEPLETELQQQLGSARMSSALRPIAVVSCDLDRGAPLIFRGGGLPQGTVGDAEMRHAARATSAGPTFFPALTYRDAQQVMHRCVDGGLIANDPAVLAFAEGQRLGAADRGGTFLLSLGTGEVQGATSSEAEDVVQLAGTAPWWKVAGPAMTALGAGPGLLAREILSSLPAVEYQRLQPTLAHGAVHAMDNVSAENTQALRMTAESFLADNAALIAGVARSLT